MGKFVLAVTVILCTVLMGVAIAQDQPPPAQKEAQKKPDKPAEKAVVKALAGEVVSIDATKNEIVIKDEGGTEIHLLISSSTKITKDGKEITIGDVKASDKLTAECDQSAEGCKAKSIQVAVPPQKN